MLKPTFKLVATVSSDSPAAVRAPLERVLRAGAKIEPTEDGFRVEATLSGESAKELNRQLLSEMRRAEKKTGLLRDIFHPEKLTTEVVERYLGQIVARPGTLVTMAEVARCAPSAQLRRDVALIAAPVLFVHGSEDRLVSPARCRPLYEELARRSSDHAFESIAGAGHMLHVTNTEAVGRAVTGWLRNRPDNRSPASSSQ